MPQKALPTDLPILPFPSQKDFDAFLEREHATAPGIHLKLAKKSSGIPSVTAAEAVESALCYGWIDGQANSIDESWWLVRYTPRRAKSIWSKKNVDTVERLMTEGRIHAAGIAAVEAAKSDGRWDRAYAGPATITVPDDFIKILNTSPAAHTFFQTLNKSDRYSVLWRVETASTQSRPKRIQALVDMLATGTIPGKHQKSNRPAKTEKSKRVSSQQVMKKAHAKRDNSRAVNIISTTQTARRPGLRSAGSA